MYFNGYDMLTHNCLFNFVIGNRGGGKTYWFKEWAIKDFLKNGKQFIYLRRYETEHDKGKKEKFFDDIKDKFPEHKFEVKGYDAYIDGKPAGNFRSLSKAKTEKSVPFPNVNKIGFDEFIIDKGYQHYLPDEVMNFLEFYETVARLRLNVSLQDDVRAFFLSNAITVTNPYFLWFNLKINPSKKYQKFKDNILVTMAINTEFIKAKKETRFGKLIEGTRYSDYAIDNKFLRDDDSFIGKKTANARYHFTMVYKGRKYGVWIDLTEGKYYVSNNIDDSCKFILTITMEDHTVNTMLIKSRQSKYLTNFTKNYQMGNVIFEDINIKNVCYEIIRLYLI